MSEERKENEMENVEVSANRRAFLTAASKACYAYLPIAGSVSSVIFSTHITNPRILHRWAILRVVTMVICNIRENPGPCLNAERPTCHS